MNLSLYNLNAKYKKFLAENPLKYIELGIRTLQRTSIFQCSPMVQFVNV